MMLFEIGVTHPLASGLTLLAGAVCALGLGWLRARKAGFAPARLALCTVLAPLCAAFVSHLLYCLVSLPEVLYSHTPGFWLAFWQNGQMMYGGLLGVVLALLLAGGRKALRLMDAYAPSAALMLAFARVVEGLCGQGYGEYWYAESLLPCRFPLMVYDPYYEGWAWALFMAEAAIAILLFLVLITRKPAFEGDHMLLLWGLYASAQIVLESLRRDEFLRWGFVRVEEVASAVVILAVLILLWVRSGRGQTMRKALCVTVFLAMVVWCLLLEFATEGRISFLTMLEVWQCYALMAAACAVNALCVLAMRRLCIRR